MATEIITKEDLDAFRSQLMTDIKQLLKEYSGRVSTEWLKAGEVRKMLKISANTLLGLRDKGKLKFSKVGGTYFYKLDDIQTLLISSSS